MPTAIWWIRRDLRLHDNPALLASLTHGRVVPLFVLDPALLQGRQHTAAQRRRDFLFSALTSLNADLEARGSRLTIRIGKPIEVLRDVLAEAGADMIIAGEDYGPYARRRDGEVQSQLTLRLVAGPTVHHPEAVKKSDGSPYTVFTPFSKAWLALPRPAATPVATPPTRIPGPDRAVVSARLPEAAAPAGFPATEHEARRRLTLFATGSEAPIDDYRARRDLLAAAGTSTLSPYLRFGLVSATEAAALATRRMTTALTPTAFQGAATWLNELIWREFYQSILFHFPYVLQTAFNPALRGIVWRDDPEGLAAWQLGRTGVPVVDAAMRQLNTTGWMHNRARMIVASFLVKDLLIDWRHGEQWFMDRLVDGDPAANNGGWQWTAGVGTDAAPYFRIFNPILQSRKYDPTGDYIRRFVPELAALPDAHIHDPAALTPIDLGGYGVLLGETYPAPIVDRAQARARTLAAYQAARTRFDQGRADRSSAP